MRCNVNNDPRYIETPDKLREETQNYKTKAAHFGNGYKIDTIPKNIYGILYQEWLSKSGEYKDIYTVFPEKTNRYLHTIEEGGIQSSLFMSGRFNHLILLRLQGIHEEWCGQPLTPVCAYGFRRYHKGAYMFSHVDKTETHIISSTLCIDYDLEEPWLFSIENTTTGTEDLIALEPGQLCFYEGAFLEHGRPFPLNGKYQTGMFIHYKPSALC